MPFNFNTLEDNDATLEQQQYEGDIDDDDVAARIEDIPESHTQEARRHDGDLDATQRYFDSQEERQHGGDVGATQPYFDPATQEYQLYEFDNDDDVEARIEPVPTINVQGERRHIHNDHMATQPINDPLATQTFIDLVDSEEDDDDEESASTKESNAKSKVIELHDDDDVQARIKEVPSADVSQEVRQGYNDPDVTQPYNDSDATQPYNENTFDLEEEEEEEKEAEVIPTEKSSFEEDYEASHERATTYATQSPREADDQDDEFLDSQFNSAEWLGDLI